MAGFLDPGLWGLSLSTPQVFALFFLLGSFTVASLSDLRHLSAQREFAEVWAAFAVVFLALDLWDAEFDPGVAFYVKWGLVAALCVLSLDRVGVLFRLAWADVLALAAAASLLSAGLVVAFALLLKVLAWPLGRLLARRSGHYPFLPVVLLATLGVLGLGAFLR